PPIYTLSLHDALPILLTTLAGVGGADVTGSVILSPPDATIGYLAQEPERVPGETILGFLSRRTGVAEAERVMNDAAERLGESGRSEEHTSELQSRENL